MFININKSIMLNKCRFLHKSKTKNISTKYNSLTIAHKKAFYKLFFRYLRELNKQKLF